MGRGTGAHSGDGGPQRERRWPQKGTEGPEQGDPSAHVREGSSVLSASAEQPGTPLYGRYVLDFCLDGVARADLGSRPNGEGNP